MLRSTVVSLLTLGWLVVWRALDVSDFRSVLARDWHGYRFVRLSAWELACHAASTSAITINSPNQYTRVTARHRLCSRDRARAGTHPGPAAESCRHGVQPYHAEVDHMTERPGRDGFSGSGFIFAAGSPEEAEAVHDAALRERFGDNKGDTVTHEARFVGL